MKELSVPVDLLQAIANYLQTKPFQEVAALMAQLAQLKPMEEKKSD